MSNYLRDDTPVQDGPNVTKTGGDAGRAAPAPGVYELEQMQLGWPKAWMQLKAANEQLRQQLAKTIQSRDAAYEELGHWVIMSRAMRLRRWVETERDRAIAAKEQAMKRVAEVEDRWQQRWNEISRENLVLRQEFAKMAEAQAKADRAIAEAASLRDKERDEALEWYAEATNWHRDTGAWEREGSSPAEQDGGARARRALGKEGE